MLSRSRTTFAAACALAVIAVVVMQATGVFERRSYRAPVSPTTAHPDADSSAPGGIDANPGTPGTDVPAPDAGSHLPAGDGDSEVSAATGVVRFLDEAVTSTSNRDSITMYVWVDAPGPHFVVSVPRREEPGRETGLPFQVRVLDQQLEPHQALEARLVSRSGGTPAGGTSGETEQYFFELAGLSALPNDRRRTYKGYVDVVGKDWQSRIPFSPIFRLYQGGISVGFDASDQKWHVNASARLADVKGIRSLAIHLFRGTSELPMEFSELLVGRHRLADVLGKDILFADDALWASGVGPKEWGELPDLVAVFDIETMDGRHLSLTWRKADDE